MNRSALMHQSNTKTSHKRNLVAKNMKPGAEMPKHTILQMYRQKYLYLHLCLLYTPTFKKSRTSLKRPS